MYPFGRMLQDGCGLQQKIIPEVGPQEVEHWKFARSLMFSHMAGVILLAVTCDLTAGPFAARCSLKTMVILQSINEVLLRWGGGSPFWPWPFLGRRLGSECSGTLNRMSTTGPKYQSLILMRAEILNDSDSDADHPQIQMSIDHQTSQSWPCQAASQRSSSAGGMRTVC